MPQDPYLHALQRCPLFKTLDPAALGALAREVVPRNFQKGRMLFRGGDDAAGFFVVRRGQVKVYRASPDGREQVLHVFGPGDMIGEVPVFQGTTFPANAMAVRETHAFFISRRTFTDAATRNPELLMAMLASVCSRLRHFVNLVDVLSLRDVPARLAGYLLAECRETPLHPVCEIDGTKAALAARLGATPETLSRVLGRMRDEKLIQIQRRTVHLIDHEGLRRLADGQA